MNWGYKILTVYIIFVTGILFLVYKSSSQNQDLVTKDYYEQELKFQDKIDETARANALSSAVKYEIKANEIVISFPEEMKAVELKAQVLLYCTADKARDIQKDTSTKNAVIHLPVPVANKGSHELKISWTANGQQYYYERKIFIK